MQEYIKNEGIRKCIVMQKNFKFRIYPIKKQEKRLELALDQACFLYNQLLDIRQQIYLGTRETLSEFDMNNILKDFELKNLHSQVKQNITKRISEAFKHFFRRVKNGDVEKGYPKFKKRVFYNSITFPQYKQETYGDRLYVSKIGMIKIIKHREIEGKIKTLTIKKENDEWYAIFSCEDCPIKEPIKEFNAEIEGLDVGIKMFLFCSNGYKYENPKWLRKAEKRIKMFQRRLSRKKKGSKNKRKARIKLNRLYTKIKRQREDFHKKLARNLAMKIKYIGVEDLNINGMVKNHHLAKSINDAGWGSFFSYLEYYKGIFDGEIIKVGRFEPTSQICSNCEHRQKIELKERDFECENCGMIKDRDLNASINIQKLAIKKLNNTEGHSGFQAYGLDVRPSMKAIEVEVGNYRENA